MPILEFCAPDRLPHGFAGTDPCGEFHCCLSGLDAMFVRRLARKVKALLVRHVSSALAGVLDSGSASLGTFLIGLLAIHSLEPDALGAYSLLFASFLTGAVVARTPHFVPIEAIGPSTWPIPVGVLPRSVLVATPAVLVGAGSALALGSLARGRPLDIGLALTLALTTIVSPIQDHARQLLHLSHRSWHAASSSVVFAAVISIFVFSQWHSPQHATDLFLYLLLANVLSLIPGIATATRHRFRPNQSLAGLARKRGIWLLAAALTPVVVTYLSRYVVARFASYADAGFAEAARTLAAPVLILASGLISAFRRQLLREGQLASRRTWELAIRATVLVTGLFWWLVLAFGPISAFVQEQTPAAYVLPGLLGLAVLSMALVAINKTSEVALLGAELDRRIFISQLAAATLRLVIIAPLTLMLGAYALPGTNSVTATVRLAVLTRAIRKNAMEKRTHNVRVEEE